MASVSAPNVYSSKFNVAVKRVAPIHGPCQLAGPVVCQRRTTVVKAKNDKSSKFLSGVVVGGAVFGALGFLFAPQISKALLSEDQRLKLPKFLEDDKPKTPDQAKQDLIQKIAKLNASIDEVASQLKFKEAETVKAPVSAQ